MNISSRDSGGVCDCGDPEAWVNQFSCKYHDIKNYPSDPIPQDLESSVLGSLEAALDFVLDVICTSDITMQKFERAEQVLELSRISQLSETVYGYTDKIKPDDNYVLVIWNDQRHSFTDVINLCHTKLHKTREFGDMIGKRVDSYGRGKLKIGSDLTNLIKIKKDADPFGFAMNIRSTHDYFREEMCDCILHWIEDLSKSPLCGNYFILKDLISKALYNPWRIGNKELLGEIPPVDQSKIPKKSTSLNGAFIPELGMYPPQALNNVDYDLKRPNTVPEHWKNDGSEPPSYKVDGISLRIQYLIFFDVRLWRSLRNMLKDLYVSVLVSNPDYKFQLGHCFAQLYPQMVEVYILTDREPECSVLTTLSTQLFTTPTIATALCEHNYFSKFMAGIYNFFTQFRVGPVSNVLVGDSFDLTKSLKNRRYGQMFNDFEFIVSRNTKKHLVTGNPNRIAQLCDFLILFQGILPMKREKKSHVEYESDMWISYFNCLPLIHQLAFHIASGISACDESQVRIVIKVVAGYIYRSMFNIDRSKDIQSAKEITQPVKTISKNINLDLYHGVFDLIPCQVEEEVVSLHHPLHTLLSLLIQYGNLKSSTDFSMVLSQSFSNAPDVAMSCLFDYPIRVLVLLSQIRIGLWVRNGTSLKSQMSYYKDLTLRDHAYDRDVFMVQTFLVSYKPENVFIQLMDRWGMLSLSSNPNFSENQKIYILEDFIHYLIVFISERRQLLGLPAPEVKKKYIRKEIIQCLAFGSLSYSEMSSIIPDMLTNDELFEGVLLELAEFVPPTGIRDTGKYQLKDEFFKYFDTHYLYFSSSKIFDAENLMKKYFHDKTKKPLDSVVIEPYLESIESGPFKNIAAFTRTQAFASFLFSVFSFVSREGSVDQELDVILGSTLYLCHLAALDDLAIQHDSDEQSFVYIISMDYDYTPSEFLPISVNTTGKGNVLEILFSMSKNQQFKSFKHQILRIIELLHQKNNTIIESSLKQKFGNLSFEEIQLKPPVKSDKGDLRKIAKRKQKKLLEKFQKQQKKFAEQNKTTITDDVTLDDFIGSKDEKANTNTVDEWYFADSQCILCHMPCDSKKVFGIASNIQLSNAHRTIPFDNAEWVLEAYGMTSNLCDKSKNNDFIFSSTAKWNDYQEKKNGSSRFGPGFPHNNTIFSPVFTSCCHTMHRDCYLSYLKTASRRTNELTRNNPDSPRNGEILCPLCHSLNNTFIPIIWKPSGVWEDSSNNSDMGFNEFVMSVEKIFEGGLLSNDVQELISQNLKERALFNLNSDVASSIFGSDDFMFGQFGQTGNIVLESIKSIISTIEKDDPHISIPPLSLIRSISGTITDVELSLRCPDTDDFLLEKIPPLTLHLLRVLMDLSFLVVFCYQNGTLGNYFPYESLKPFQVGKSNDPFEQFVQVVFFFCPAFKYEKVQFLQAYTLIEIINVLIRIAGDFSNKVAWTTHEMLGELPVYSDIPDECVEAVITIVTTIQQKLNPHEKHREISKSLGKVIYTMLLKSVSPFIRKSIILTFLLDKNDAEFPKKTSSEIEIDVLCNYLKIPKISDFLVDLVNATDDSGAAYLFTKYLSHYMNSRSLPVIDYPAVQKLINLPYRLDEFFTGTMLIESTRDEVISEPAICLFCGEILELQKGSRLGGSGECNFHKKHCGKSVGIFLLPKRSSILFLSKNQGSFYQAPYLDLHGEGEESFRRRRPQFLNEKRYDYLARVYWLQHGILDYITRRLYSTADVGGWDTL